MKKVFTWSNFAIFLAIIGFILLLINAFWIFFVNKSISSSVSPIDYELASNIGSYLSGITGLFWSGAAVILIYATFKKQQEFNQNQLFEQIFNNMINSYQSLVINTREKVDVKNKNLYEEYFGRGFYSAFFKKIKNSFNSRYFIEDLLKYDSIDEVKEFKNRYKNETNKQSLIEKFQKELLNIVKVNKKCSKELSIARYEYMYKKHQAVLGHYFRLIYNTFKIIIEKNESHYERARYINLLQALMSNDELGILFYNAISRYARNSEGKYQFEKWLIEYDFFENIDKDSLLNENDAIFYPINYKFKKK